MVGDLPSGLGKGPTAEPPAENWSPPSVGQPASRSRPWLAIVVAVTAAVAVGALIVALTRPTATKPSTTTIAPACSAAETAAARQKLCDTCQLARAVQIEPNGTSPERAGIAEVNGAIMLKDAVNSSPAIAPTDRTNAIALAEAYSNVALRASLATGSDDPAWRSALDEANSRDAAVKKACGGG